MDKLTIVSIVATGKINREFNLEAIEEDLNTHSCQHVPRQSPGLHITFYEGGPTVTLFRSGSFNIRGGSTVEELHKNKSLLKSRIFELGIETTISSFAVTNMVFTADLGKQLDLNETSIKLGLENIEYEPEQFPGLVYRLERGVILTFSSGKLVLTGFTEVKDAQQAYNEILNQLICT